MSNPPCGDIGDGTGDVHVHQFYARSFGSQYASHSVVWCRCSKLALSYTVAEVRRIFHGMIHSHHDAVVEDGKSRDRSCRMLRRKHELSKSRTAVC